MNNAELEKLLRVVPEPEPAPPYWDEFPVRTAAVAHRRASRAAAEPTRHTRPVSPIVLRWGYALAAACVLIALVFAFRKEPARGITPEQLAVARKYYRELESLFPNQIRSIVLDDQGPHLNLAERPEVPSEPPVYLRVCGAHGCRAFLTFSGQQIQLDSQSVDVLVNARGQVLLAGADFAWSSAEANRAPGQWHIAATALNGASL